MKPKNSQRDRLRWPTVIWVFMRQRDWFTAKPKRGEKSIGGPRRFMSKGYAYGFFNSYAAPHFQPPVSPAVSF